MNQENFSCKTSHTDLIDYLKLVLSERQHRNPRYSLRSFASTLQLSPSFVSKLLNRKRKLTSDTFEKVAMRLQMNPKLVYQFRSHYFSKLSNFNFEEETQINFNKNKKYQLIEEDQFQFISKWYHFAILELINLSSFKPNSSYIAAQLKITPFQAKEAFARLIRLGYVKISKSKNHQRVYLAENYSTIGSAIAKVAGRNQQKEFLDLAINAIEEVPYDQRSQTSMTMAIPIERIEEAKGLINEFRRNITEILQRPGEPDAVYQLSISFFPLTKL